MTLTHFDQSGHAQMVDIGDKHSTQRKAVAEGCITMLPTTLAMIRSGSATKGDVLGIARIAAIQAAKRTFELIPLCHLLSLTRVAVDFTESINPHAIRCRVAVQCQGQTGVEMEALTAVNIGLLTIYDMCKAVDRGMTITDIQLLEKSGGRSGHWQREVPAAKS